MNLYLVERKIPGDDWDEFESFVCVAKDSNEAINMNPSSIEHGNPIDFSMEICGWVNSTKELNVTYLGKFDNKLKHKIICFNFHNS